MSEATQDPIAGPWEANASDGALKVRGPATAKRYKQREVCRIYFANRATVDLICAAPDLLAACEAAKAFVERMRVPQDIAQAAEQIAQGMLLIRSLDAATAKATGAK